MVKPPFEQEYAEGETGDGAPKFHIGRLKRGGCDLGVFAELEFVAWFDVAFGGIQKIGAEEGVVSANVEVVDALLERIAENELGCVGAKRQCFRRAAGQRDGGVF